MVVASEHVAQAEKEVEEAVEGINPHKEAQDLMNRLKRSRPIFEVDVHPQPSFKDFSDSLLSAQQNNVRALPFSGHGQSHFPVMASPKMFGDSGPISDKAHRVDLARLKKAIKSLKKSLAKRGNSGHDFMRERIEECVYERMSCLDKCLRTLEEEELAAGCSDLAVT
jgi:hypothetical protein